MTARPHPCLLGRTAAAPWCRIGTTPLPSTERTAAGTYPVEITGIGNYTGTATSRTLVDRSQDIAGSAVTPPQDGSVYTPAALWSLGGHPVTVDGPHPSQARLHRVTPTTLQVAP